MTVSRDEFQSKFREYTDCVAILNTGMPQATEHEQRAMHARERELRRLLEGCPWTLSDAGEVVYKSRSRRFLESMDKLVRKFRMT